MMRIPDTVKGYSEYAAREFLQTAVFIDDRIYDSKAGPDAEGGELTAPKPRKRALKSAAGPERNEAGATIIEENEEYSPHDIVNSFAKKQIICSLYQPTTKARVTSESDIFLLCRSADIVIVDWDLFGDDGSRALELIDGLIRQAVNDVPEQLRLILVYTQETDLGSIAEKLHEKVQESIGEVLPRLDNDLTFRTTNSRVSVLGKVGRTRPVTSNDHVVKESELAERAVKEFAGLADGLLHAATLLGLAEIKKNSRRILSKFSKELDPAFLTHLAMSLPMEDASEHITPLLVSEIEAVLRDVLPTPLISRALLYDWCRNVWQTGKHLDNLFTQDGSDKRAIAEAICIEGFEEARKRFSQIPNPSNNKRTRKAAEILLESGEDNANHRFAQLMASRSFYGDAVRKPKVLKLGSIVYHAEDDTYLLCIQPLCDSVLIESDRRFLFVELAKVEPGPDTPDKRASHIVVQENGDPLELHYQPKSYRCRSVTFSPDPEMKQVQTKSSGNEKSVFNDKSGYCYEWIDELKEAHAQRAVEKLAGDLSRVGLTESEWLRRLNRQ